MEVGTSRAITMNANRSSRAFDSNDAPLSPIRERTKKAIAQHRAWRQPDLRRSYTGISLSAVAQRHLDVTTNIPSSESQSNLNENIRSNVIPHITISRSGSSSIPYDAAAAVYEDIELSESRLSVDDHLQQIENLMLSPSMRSNVSSNSDRSASSNNNNNNNLLDEVVDTFHQGEFQDSRLGIAANEVYDANPSNVVDLLERQQYVYESYRTLQQHSPSMLATGDALQPLSPQPIVFRDEESVGTGMSQQELIRKKARTNRRKRLSSKARTPILQLPAQLLIPPRISTPRRQSYCNMQKKEPSVLAAPPKQHRPIGKSKSVLYQPYDGSEELESLSTTAETANESGETPPENAVVVSRSSETISPTTDPQRLQRRRHPPQPTLAVRGDDALLWIEPIDQRSLGEESFAASYRSRSDDRDHGSDDDVQNVEIESRRAVAPAQTADTLPFSNQMDDVSLMTAQVNRTSVRFARADAVGREDDESSMPWDQKTDLKRKAMNPLAAALDNIEEEAHVAESPITPITKATIPKSILRKSRYKASRMGDQIGNDATRNHIDDSESNHSPMKDAENEPTRHSMEFSPPRMTSKGLDMDGLDLSPIPHGLEPDHQSIFEESESYNMTPLTYTMHGHPAEKHIHQTMATFLAMRDGELADHVRDQEIYPDPPLEIDIEDDETVLSAYVFIETVAAIVIQTAVRQFLAVLYLDSLRQTRDSFEVAQRVLSIEEGCLEESMNTCSRTTSSLENEQNDYSYENLIEDDLDRAAQDMYELAAIQIQSAYRGFWVRDCVDVDHYCATALQRMYRGLRCRKDYACERRRIVLVQSWFRRNSARDHAANILAYAIVIQSAVRAFIIRKSYRRYCEHKLFIRHAAATIIQARWRSFVCEAHFIRSLVDVLIVQTVVRKWIARQKVARVRRERILSTEPLQNQSTLDTLDTLTTNNPNRALDTLTSNGPNQAVEFKDRISDKTNGTANIPTLKQTNILPPTHHPKSIAKIKNGNSDISPSDPIRSSSSHASSVKIVNKKSMDVTIVNDSKWRAAAERCITPETKKLYTKSKVVAYPMSDDDGSSCNESYKIVRNTMIIASGVDVDPEATTIPVHTTQFSATNRTDESLEVPTQGTTTNLLSIWKQKEKQNGFQHRKALV